MSEELKHVDPRQIFQEIFKMEKYRSRLSQMAVEGSTSLVLDFEDLRVADEELAKELIMNPRAILDYASKAAYEQLKIEDPEYANVIEKVAVRVRGLPTPISLRKLGSDYIGKLVMVEGIVVRATPVRPMIVEAAFKCRRCKTIKRVPQSGMTITRPTTCESEACRGRRSTFDLVEEETKFVDYQEIRIQEKPEDLPPGQLPRSVNVRLVGSDLVDTARPGDRVSIVGIVRVTSPRGEGRLRIFDIYLDANFIDVKSKEAEAVIISPEDEKKILELSKDPFIHRKIVQSIAPSIYGYEHIKEAIMYLLFGGVPKTLPDGYIRGNINILLIGDPGVGKSRLLQYVAAIAPRGLYTTGRGTTAAGLTAAVLREAGGGMTLEAGALVLSDMGICCIDEIEKMRPEDRVAIHEAMAQNTISIAKGGIVATLNARTAILAAANPALGRYDPYRTVAENISLPITILSRFDLIFVLRDVPDKERDTEMSEHILNIHKRAHSSIEPPIPPDFLRKYISYAKTINPVLTDEAIERLKEFYLTMRSAGEGEGSPIAITARQLEALIRIAEARARAALREKVTAEDAEAAIAIMKKSLSEVGVDVETKKFDIDVIMTGKPKSVRDKLQTILEVLIELEKKIGMVEKGTLIKTLESDYGIKAGEAQRLISILMRDGTIYEPKPGYLKKV